MPHRIIRVIRQHASMAQLLHHQSTNDSTKVHGRSYNIEPRRQQRLTHRIRTHRNNNGTHKTNNTTIITRRMDRTRRQRKNILPRKSNQNITMASPSTHTHNNKTHIHNIRQTNTTQNKTRKHIRTQTLQIDTHTTQTNHSITCTATKFTSHRRNKQYVIHSNQHWPHATDKNTTHPSTPNSAACSQPEHYDQYQ